MDAVHPSFPPAGPDSLEGKILALMGEPRDLGISWDGDDLVSRTFQWSAHGLMAQMELKYNSSPVLDDNGEEDASLGTFIGTQTEFIVRRLNRPATEPNLFEDTDFEGEDVYQGDDANTVKRTMENYARDDRECSLALSESQQAQEMYDAILALRLGISPSNTGALEHLANSGTPLEGLTPDDPRVQLALRLSHNP